MTQSIQPQESIQNNGAEEPASQAQQDYDEGLEQLKNKSLPQAAASFHNALRGFEEEGNKAGIARAATKLAEICLMREEHSKALEHLQMALPICREADDHLSVTYLQKQLFYANMALKKWGIVQELGLELLDIYQDYNNPAGAVEILERMGEAHLEAGQPEKAAESWRTAAAIHRNFKHHRAAQDLLTRAETALRG